MRMDRRTWKNINMKCRLGCDNINFQRCNFKEFEKVLKSNHHLDFIDAFIILAFAVRLFNIWPGKW